MLRHKQFVTETTLRLDKRTGLAGFQGNEFYSEHDRHNPDMLHVTSTRRGQYLACTIKLYEYSFSSYRSSAISKLSVYHRQLSKKFANKSKKRLEHHT